MTTLDSFSLFPKLIPELRVHIWHHALIIPRLVFIWKHESRGAQYLRRSSASPLLTVNVEARREALRYYSSPHDGPCVLPGLASPSLTSDSALNHHQEQKNLQSSSLPYYIGPGTDILYISGSDPQHRQYKPVTWTCITLSRDLDSPSPTFAPIRRLAVDELFLRSTPLFHYGKMPYSVWKFMLCDLRGLEELWVVKAEDKDSRKRGGTEKSIQWGKIEVEARLKEAKEGFKGYLEEVWEDEAGPEEIAGWKLPEVREVQFEELVDSCWTSWD